MRRQESRGNSKSIKPSHALISRRVRSVPSCRCWNQQRRWSARDSLIVNTSGYGAYAEIFPFVVGASDVARVLVCIEGTGHIEHGGARYAVGKGDVFLLPAVIGVCDFQPSSAVTLLEIALPD